MITTRAALARSLSAHCRNSSECQGPTTKVYISASGKQMLSVRNVVAQSALDHHARHGPILAQFVKV